VVVGVEVDAYHAHVNGRECGARQTVLPVLVCRLRSGKRPPERGRVSWFARN
jgi:hypothetical protein